MTYLSFMFEKFYSKMMLYDLFYYLSFILSITDRSESYVYIVYWKKNQGLIKLNKLQL